MDFQAKYSPVKREVEFARVTPASRTSILTVNIKEKDERGSYVDVTYTGISEEGNKFIDGYAGELPQGNLERRKNP